MFSREEGWRKREGKVGREEGRGRVDGGWKMVVARLLEEEDVDAEGAKERVDERRSFRELWGKRGDVEGGKASGPLGRGT